jgi:GNAT superfamily N-acetyltransferase
MPTAVRQAQLAEIEPLRTQYRQEMDCQIIHDSIHGRPGWTREYAIEMDGVLVGYGSLAIDGPWRDTPAHYEFYLQQEYRMRMFELFGALLAACSAKVIETQSNDRTLSVLLHTFSKSVRTESILFEDAFQTSHVPVGAGFRAVTTEDIPFLRERNLDEGASGLVEVDGEIAGAGGILYHYNPPYGDIYMKIAESYRRKGLGAFLVQELKAVCPAGGHIPAARCGVDNLASRRTLQNSGFVPCGNIISGDLPSLASLER